MAHYPRPFFRPARKLWYAQLDGKQINLGSDRAIAFKTYHALMQQRGKSGEATIRKSSEQQLVIVLVDEFLDWCQKHRAPDTFRWYKDRLNPDYSAPS